MPLPNAGEEIEASDWSDVFPVGVDAWPAYTPTLTQGATVTKTVAYGKYQKTGRKVTAEASMSVTGAGTAANVLLFGLPVAAVAGSQTAIGDAVLFDASTGFFYSGTAVIHDANTAKFVGNGASNYIGISQFTAGLAVGAFVTFAVEYESAS